MQFQNEQSIAITAYEIDMDSTAEVYGLEAVGSPCSEFEVDNENTMLVMEQAEGMAPEVESAGDVLEMGFNACACLESAFSEPLQVYLRESLDGAECENTAEKLFAAVQSLTSPAHGVISSEVAEKIQAYVEENSEKIESISLHMCMESDHLVAEVTIKLLESFSDINNLECPGSLNFLSITALPVVDAEQLGSSLLETVSGPESNLISTVGEICNNVVNSTPELISRIASIGSFPVEN
ncbi:uncharacterized protein NEMAJ01_1778 [Nematocida major]|uniref:uncharacterized protein n=1 Tax=Nematocida major TaxID=1912982 RepID=UPI0020073A95|nr:uncharacterized protein NEMAJ01_1778 [Nematocida major]KAH9386882.1 hypothetical protein NEMAJ01_1778 [Nematocida major]